MLNSQSEIAGRPVFNYFNKKQNQCKVKRFNLNEVNKR